MNWPMSHWQLAVRRGWSIFTTVVGKQYNSEPCSILPRGACLLNTSTWLDVRQHSKCFLFSHLIYLHGPLLIPAGAVAVGPTAHIASHLPRCPLLLISSLDSRDSPGDEVHPALTWDSLVAWRNPVFLGANLNTWSLKTRGWIPLTLILWRDD